MYPVEEKRQSGLGSEVEREKVGRQLPKVLPPRSCWDVGSTLAMEEHSVLSAPRAGWVVCNKHIQELRCGYMEEWGWHIGMIISYVPFKEGWMPAVRWECCPKISIVMGGDFPCNLPFQHLHQALNIHLLLHLSSCFQASLPLHLSHIREAGQTAPHLICNTENILWRWLNNSHSPSSLNKPCCHQSLLLFLRWSARQGGKDGPIKTGISSHLSATICLRWTEVVRNFPSKPFMMENGKHLKQSLLALQIFVFCLKA